MKNHPHRTAITRTALSAPMAALSKKGLVWGRSLDYGCGKGSDADLLGSVSKYDPYFFPTPPRGQYDTITCNYVLNVLPEKAERLAVLKAIQNLLAWNGKAYISVRGDRTKLRGWTKRGTWQGDIHLNLPVLARGKFRTYRLDKGSDLSNVEA